MWHQRVACNATCAWGDPSRPEQAQRKKCAPPVEETHTARAAGSVTTATAPRLANATRAKVPGAMQKGSTVWRGVGWSLAGPTRRIGAPLYGTAIERAGIHENAQEEHKRYWPVAIAAQMPEDNN